jgi:hypothetical protein
LGLTHSPSVASRTSARGSYLIVCLIQSGARLNRMEEDGARLNRSRLASAYLLACSLAGRPRPETQPQSRIRPRAGAVKEAVIQVLVAADGPLRAREIHAAAQQLAGTPHSWNTVKDCLHKHAGRPDSPGRTRPVPPPLRVERTLGFTVDV